MGRILFPDSIRPIERVNTTQVKLPAGSRVTVGGQQYTALTDRFLSTGTIGFGGLDAGAVGAFQQWRVFAVVSGGALGLVASQSSAPVGFSAYNHLGLFATDNGSAVAAAGETTAFLAANKMRGQFGRTGGFSISGDTEAGPAITALTPSTVFGISLSGSADFQFMRAAQMRVIVNGRWRNDVWVKCYLRDMLTTLIAGESISAGASNVAANQPGAFDFLADVVPGRTYRFLIAASGSSVTIDTPTPSGTFTNFTGRNLNFTVSMAEV